MKDLSAPIETLARETERLIRAYRVSREKVGALTAENGKLKTKAEGLNIEIERLKEENKVLRMVAAIKGDEQSVAETKRKISQMVREIDRCIVQLND